MSQLIIHDEMYNNPPIDNPTSNQEQQVMSIKVEPNRNQTEP